MLAFEDIKPGCRVRGVDPSGVSEIVQVARFGPDAINLVFRAGGRVAERLVYRGDEAGFELVEAGRTYSFDADGALLRLASEAYRVRLAYLFDPYLAVTASQIEALPHQITAVYGEMLPRQPLRFLLADDPGAGKTIMAGLLIKELLIRGDLERCLIVAPGVLVEQWQEELAEKFGLAFEILSRDQIEASLTGNPFIERKRLVVRLDMLSRSDELRAKFEASSDWDLIICDEAHRMAASYFSGEVKETKRYKLGKLLGTRTRHLLLMTATPHNGKEADFQLFGSPHSQPPRRFPIAKRVSRSPVEPHSARTTAPMPHQLPVLVEDVRAAIGALNLGADLMSHGLLDIGVGNRRDLLRPGPEGRPETVCGNRPTPDRVEPLLLARVHALQEGHERHVG